MSYCDWISAKKLLSMTSHQKMCQFTRCVCVSVGTFGFSFFLRQTRKSRTFSWRMKRFGTSILVANNHRMIEQSNRIRLKCPLRARGHCRHSATKRKIMENWIEVHTKQTKRKIFFFPQRHVVVYAYRIVYNINNDDDDDDRIWHWTQFDGQIQLSNRQTKLWFWFSLKFLNTIEKGHIYAFKIKQSTELNSSKKWEESTNWFRFCVIASEPKHYAR